MIRLIAADLSAKTYALIPLTFPTKFPAMFGGARGVYGLALFSQVLMSLLSIAAIIELVRLYRTYNEPFRSPAQMHRVALGLILFGMVMLSLPGAVFNLLWHDPSLGDHEVAVLRTVQQFRIAAQGLAWMPFLAGMTVLSLSRHAITFQLIRQPLPVDLWSNRSQMIQSARLGLACLVIAVLVALYK